MSPTAAPRPCTHLGCGRLRCERHRSLSAAKRGYGRRWQRARLRFLRAHPICEMDCKREGRITAGTVVDHIVAHRGDQKRFWDQSNWQAGCAPCHNRKTVKEDGGFGR